MSEEEYLTKRQEIEHLYSSPSPDFQMDLSSDISIKRGVGIAEFSRPSTRVYLNKSGVSSTAEVDEPCWTIWFELLERILARVYYSFYRGT